MTIDIKIKQHNDFLEIIATGPYDLNEAINQFPHVLDVCRLSGLQKVLIDIRGLERQGSATEKSLYALGVVDHYENYLKLGGNELQIAYVDSIVTAYEPGAQIGERSKVHFKLFDKVDEALEWLGVKIT